MIENVGLSLTPKVKFVKDGMVENVGLSLTPKVKSVKLGTFIVFSLPAKATLKESDSNIAKITIISALLEFFINIPPNFSNCSAWIKYKGFDAINSSLLQNFKT